MIILDAEWLKAAFGTAVCIIASYQILKIWLGVK